MYLNKISITIFTKPHTQTGCAIYKFTGVFKYQLMSAMTLIKSN